LLIVVRSHLSIFLAPESFCYALNKVLIHFVVAQMIGDIINSTEMR